MCAFEMDYTQADARDHFLGTHYVSSRGLKDKSKVRGDFWHGFR